MCVCFSIECVEHVTRWCWWWWEQHERERESVTQNQRICRESSICCCCCCSMLMLSTVILPITFLCEFFSCCSNSNQNTQKYVSYIDSSCPQLGGLLHALTQRTYIFAPALCPSIHTKERSAREPIGILKFRNHLCVACERRFYFFFCIFYWFILVLMLLLLPLSSLWLYRSFIIAISLHFVFSLCHNLIRSPFLALWFVWV